MCLTNSVEELFLLNIELEALVENTACENSAFSALACQPKFSPNLAELCGAFFDSFPDLAVGYRIAHTNVHKIAQYLFMILIKYRQILS